MVTVLDSIIDDEYTHVIILAEGDKGKKKSSSFRVT
jgi:hypothetical protein